RLRLVDRLALSLQRVRVDDGPHEVGEVADVAHLQLLDLVGEPVAQCRPEVRGGVDPRGGRAFLSLVFERAADDRGRDGVDVGGGVGDDEVLPTGLADDPRGVAVLTDLRADRLPHRVEDARRAGDVTPGDAG